jgi:group I intron endonuclease
MRKLKNIMYGYIYKTINLITGDMYIGKHKSMYMIDKRYKGSGKILKRAFKKYGKDNFKCEILEPVNNVPTICSSLEELNNSEKYYINLYDCVNNPKYYNLVLGGEGGDTVSNLTEQEKQTRSALISKKLKNFVWVYNKETKEQLRILSEELEYYLSLGFLRGFKYRKSRSIESYKKQSVSQKKIHLSPEEEKNIIKKYIEGYSVSECSKMFNLNSNYINRLLKINKVPKRTISDAKKTYFKHNIVSEETRNKQSLKRKGIKKTKEWKENIKKSNLGKKVSDKTKELLRESILGRVWINNGTVRKQIKKNEVESYMKMGYVMGKGKTLKKGE